MSLASAQLSSEERPIGLRTRPDLVIQESVYQGERCWIVKDPIAMKYFRLLRPEYLVLNKLRQVTSYHDIRLLLTRQFPEAITRLSSVQQLVISLHRNGLLISDSTDQAMPLKKRRNRELRQKAIGLMSSLVSLRFPGWDPQRFLDWIYPKCSFVFSRWFTAVVALVCLSAALLVATNFETFMAKLPEFQSFFAVDNLIFMGFILIFTKSIHELGHGLMCRHFGGECHQIGFMLLVMTPAMYCDTSDSWTLPNRWHRMAIGAAGMYIELFMAAICTFIWWFTNPGWIHYLALNIMFLGSFSTVVFNANPLLRYDGYYILSDFLEIPNLAQKSRLSLISKLRVWCLGMKPVNARVLPQRHQVAFAIYSVSSFVYRWVVMIMIFWFIAEIFEPWGLAAVGHILIAISLTGMIVVPLYKMTKFFLYPGRLREVKKPRFYFTLVATTTVLAFFCFFPLPHYVWADFVVRPQNAQMVSLALPGTLQQVDRHEGDRVEPQDVIAVLKNDELELELEQLQGNLARLNTELTGYQLTSYIRPDAADRIAETETKIRSTEKQIEVKQRQKQQLVIRAKRSGELFSPQNFPLRSQPETELATWSGTPLDTKNLGTYLEQNTLLGIVGEPGEMEAIFVVDQSDVKLLKQGQQVVVLCHQFRTDFLQTTISFVAQDELTVVPRELSQTNGGPIAVKPDASGLEKPMLKYYEAHAKFDASELEGRQVRLLPGMRGRAKIRVGSASLGSRLFRYLSTVVNFR